MPVPPGVVLMLGGPKYAAVKAAAFEILPAITSASTAAILARLVWKRIPDWVKEDVSFRNSTTKNGTESTSSSDVERLAAVLEKIQAWIEACSEQLQRPVPHLYASFLIYWQLLAQQQRQRMKNKSENEMVNDLPKDTTLADHYIVEMNNNASFHTLIDMLKLATWAYYIEDATDLEEKLQTLDFELKTCVLPSRPGSVGYYVAFQRQKDRSVKVDSPKSRSRTMILGIRGTSTLEELLTDACGRSVTYEGPDRYVDDSGEGLSSSIRVEVLAREPDHVCCLSGPSQVDDLRNVEVISGHERIYVEHDFEACEMSKHRDDHHDQQSHLPGRPFIQRSSYLDSQIRCHEGILMSAKRLFLQVRPIIEEKIVRGDFQLVIVGHSLGASVGCLLALMLRSRYPELIQEGLLHVYAFGPPPVLDYDSAIGASLYITSVVHDSDLISRCSLVNLAVLIELLRIVSDSLIARGMAPTNPRAAVALLTQLSKGDKGEPFWSEQNLYDAMAEAQANVTLRNPDHLYVPGKLLLLTPFERVESEEPHVSLGNKTSRSYSCLVTDGTTASLRAIEMNGYQMLGDHTTAAYLAAIASLADQARNLDAMST